MVNSGNSFSGKTIYLENDLNLGENAWLGIGNYYNSTERSFRGVFDGQSHTISMQGGFTTENQPNFGLFGLTNGAVIKNLVLTGRTIFSGTGTYVSYTRVGGLIGWSKSTTVENVSNRKEIQVTGYSYIYVGGLIGMAESTTLTACNNIGPVSTAASVAYGRRPGRFGVGCQRF